MPPIEILSVEEASERAAPTTVATKDRIPTRRRFYALSLKDHFRLLLPFLLAGAAGVLARVKYPYWWPANELVYFLADALIVAMILGIAFDVFSAKLLVERISDGLAQTLVGRGLPRNARTGSRCCFYRSGARSLCEKLFVFESRGRTYTR